jgi:hypothetical protein
MIGTCLRSGTRLCQEMLELEVERVELVWVRQQSLASPVDTEYQLTGQGGRGRLRSAMTVSAITPWTHDRLTWWSSFCGRPDTTTAPMGVRSHPLIQIGMAGTSARRECNVSGYGDERAGVRCKMQDARCRCVSQTTGRPQDAK